MKTFIDCAAQGDILIRRISEIPADAVKQDTENGHHVVAHSETGHHHTIADRGVQFYHAANDSMVMYLAVDNEADLIHNRSFDTHEPLRIGKGLYEIRRQREYTPEGWRRVAD